MDTNVSGQDDDLPARRRRPDPRLLAAGSGGVWQWWQDRGEARRPDLNAGTVLHLAATAHPLAYLLARPFF